MTNDTKRAIQILNCYLDDASGGYVIPEHIIGVCLSALRAQAERDEDKLLLYMVVRMKVMQTGLELGKTSKEIDQMAYDSMMAMYEMVDWEQAKKLFDSIIDHEPKEAQG